MTLALLGIPPHILQAIGCWSSDEWQKYVQKHAFLQQALLHTHPPTLAGGNEAVPSGLPHPLQTF